MEKVKNAYFDKGDSDIYHVRLSSAIQFERFGPLVHDLWRIEYVLTKTVDYFRDIRIISASCAYYEGILTHDFLPCLGYYKRRPFIQSNQLTSYASFLDRDNYMVHSLSDRCPKVYEEPKGELIYKLLYI